MKNKTKLIPVLVMVFIGIFALSGCSNSAPIANEDGSIIDYQYGELEEGFFVIKEGDKYQKPLTQGVFSTGQGEAVWFTNYDNLIPEIGPSDKLIYIDYSNQPIQTDFISLVDNNYTVGIQFDSQITGESQTISFPSGGNKFCPSSPVGSIVSNNVPNNNSIIEVNGKEIKPTMFTSDGFMKGLTKDAMYKFSYTVGTSYNQINVKADTHLFTSDVTYSTFSYVPTTDKYFFVNLPPELPNGYYLIDGLHMIKYTGNSSSPIEPVPAPQIKEGKS